MNDWQPGRCQSKCDLPHPHSLEKWFKPQNELFWTSFFNGYIYFHSDFCGCFKRLSTLVSYMHFYYFKPNLLKPSGSNNKTQVEGGEERVIIQHKILKNEQNNLGECVKLQQIQRKLPQWQSTLTQKQLQHAAVNKLVVPILISVSENAADTAENAGIGNGRYISPCTNQIPMSFISPEMVLSYLTISPVSSDWHYIPEINLSLPL